MVETRQPYWPEWSEPRSAATHYVPGILKFHGRSARLPCKFKLFKRFSTGHGYSSDGSQPLISAWDTSFSTWYTWISTRDTQGFLRVCRAQRGARWSFRSGVSGYGRCGLILSMPKVGRGMHGGGGSVLPTCRFVFGFVLHV